MFEGVMGGGESTEEGEPLVARVKSVQKSGFDGIHGLVADGKI